MSVVLGRAMTAALCALALSGCRTSAVRREPVASEPVAGALAETPAAPKTPTGLLGVVVAPQTVDITAQLDGRLLDVVVRAGDHVERGAVLAHLDGRTVRQELAIARAELASAVAERERARLDVAQAAERVARRDTVVQLPSETVAATVSREELSTSRYEQRVAEARLASADAAVLQRRAHFEQVKLLVKEGAVRAPFSGVIVTRYADGGSAVRKGTPVVRLLEGGELKVRFAIGEESADQIDVGSPLRVVVAGEALSAAVEKVAPEVDAAARMVFAEAALSVPSGLVRRIRSGQVARVFVDPQAETAR